MAESVHCHWYDQPRVEQPGLYPEHDTDRRILAGILRLNADPRSTLHQTFCHSTRHHLARLATNGFTDTEIAAELGYLTKQTEDEPRGPYDDVREEVAG